MPRKNPRPAQKKRLAKQKARLENKALLDKKARPYWRDPHHGDGAILAAFATSFIRRPV